MPGLIGRCHHLTRRRVSLCHIDTSILKSSTALYNTLHRTHTTLTCTPISANTPPEYTAGVRHDMAINKHNRLSRAHCTRACAQRALGEPAGSAGPAVATAAVVVVTLTTTRTYLRPPPPHQPNTPLGIGAGIKHEIMHSTKQDNTTHRQLFYVTILSHFLSTPCAKCNIQLSFLHHSSTSASRDKRKTQDTEGLRARIYQREH